MSACAVCEKNPAYNSFNLMNDQRTASDIEPLLDSLGIYIGSGTNETITCPVCNTHYRLEIDVEPFVWDVVLERIENPT